MFFSLMKRTNPERDPFGGIQGLTKIYLSPFTKFLGNNNSPAEAGSDRLFPFSEFL